MSVWTLRIGVVVMTAVAIEGWWLRDWANLVAGLVAVAVLLLITPKVAADRDAARAEARRRTPLGPDLERIHDD